LKLLITGCTGFIGKHLTKFLYHKGYDLTCLIRKTSNTSNIEDLNIRFIVADLTDKANLENLPDDIETVIHLAAQVDFSAVSDKVYKNMIETNVNAVENLFKVMNKKSTDFKRFIHFSSLAALGFRRGIKVNNQTKADPETLYGKSKLESENLLKQLCKDFDKELVIIRPSLVYGEQDYKSDFLQSVRLINKGIFPVFGNGNNIMSPFIYIEDLCEICYRFVESKTTGSYICAMDEGFSINEFVKILSKILNKKRGAIRVPTCLGQALIFPLEIISRILNKPAPLTRKRIKDLSLDRKFKNIHTDLKKAIDYVPQKTLEEGATSTISWYRLEKLI